MADNLVIKIDGDASHLEKELNNAAGTGVRAFKRFGDGTNEQLDRMQDMVDDLRTKLIEMGDDGEEAMEDFGDAGERALDTVKKEAKSTGKAAGESMEDAAKRSENAWNKVKGVLKAIAGAAVVREIMKIGKEAVGLASDLDEVQNVIDVTFGEGNQKIERFSQNAAKQFGISELSAKKMAGTMGAMLKSLDVKNVDDMSISLVGLAADMGSFYNMEAEEAFAKLRSGISGETEPLKQLGINMSVANLEAFALSQGLKKEFKDMTAAEQATLRYNYIMKATADAQGDFTRTSGSMANQLKIAKLNVENMKAALGKSLLPAATAAVHGLNNLVTIVQNGFPAVKSTISNFVQNAGAELDKFGIGERLTAGLSVAKDAVNEAIGFVLNVFQSAAKSPVLQAIGDALKNAFSNFLSMWDSIGELLSTLWVYLEPVWEGLKAGVGNFVDAFLQAKLTLVTVVNQIYDFIKGAIDFVIGILTLDKERIITGFLGMKDSLINIAQTIWQGLGTVLTSIWNGVTTFLNTLWEKIKKKAAEIDLKKNGKDLLESLKKGIDEGWQAVKTWFSTTKDAALKKLSEIDLKEKAIDLLSTFYAGLITAWGTVLVWIGERVQDVLDALGKIDLKQVASDIIETLKQGFISGVETVKKWFKETREGAEETLNSIDLKEVGKKIVGSIKDGFVDAWNGFVKTLEDLINKTLDKIPDWLKEKLGIEGNITLTSTADELPAPKGTQKDLGVYPAGTMTPEQALEAYEKTQRKAGNMEAMPLAGRAQLVANAEQEAAAKLAEAAEAIEETAERSTPTNPFTGMSVPGMDGGYMPYGDPRAKKPSAEEQAVLDAQQAAAGAVSTAAEAAGEAAADVSGTSETVAAAAESEQAVIDGMDDGIQFTWDDENMQTALDALTANEPKGDGGTPNYVGMVGEWITNSIKQLSDDTTKSLDGVDSDMNNGFDAVTGGGNGGGSSDATLLDEYNELMGLWSNNKDANGEWIADWSEGGIGQTLADLIQGKMPGKYWDDLTDEDKERMSRMTASEGYTAGKWTAQFAPEEPVTIPANLDVVSIEGSGAEDGGTLDLGALKEAIPEETILSWQNLDAALQSVMTTLSGGEEGGAGLASVLESISTLMNEGIPNGITLMSGALTGTLPSAVTTALASLGNFEVGEDGELIAGGGNTLYTAMGTIKVLWEDTNTAIDDFCKHLTGTIPGAVESFKNTAGTAQALVQGLFTAASSAADAFFLMAAGIDAAVDALARLGAGGSGDSDGSGTVPVFAAAHGGQHSGVGVVGENGPEIISTSRNLNVFTNRALEIAQDKVAGMMSRNTWFGGANQTSISNDNSRSTTVNVGTVLGSDWLGEEMNRRITRRIERELFYAR